MYRLEVYKDYDEGERVITHYDFETLIELLKFIVNNFEEINNVCKDDDYNYKVFVKIRR